MVIILAKDKFFIKKINIQKNRLFHRVSGEAAGVEKML